MKKTKQNKTKQNKTNKSRLRTRVLPSFFVSARGRMGVGVMMLWFSFMRGQREVLFLCLFMIMIIMVMIIVFIYFSFLLLLFFHCRARLVFGRVGDFIASVSKLL